MCSVGMGVPRDEWRMELVCLLEEKKKKHGSEFEEGASER